MSGATLTIAHHIATARGEDIPAAARRAAERSLLDAVGVMLGATTLGEECAAFADIAEMSPGPCTLLGRAARVQPLQAALANGALAHAMDYEDALDGAPVHPNAAGIPVAMALAEADASITGAEFITAVALGCDFTCRLGLALDRNPDEFGWYPPPILSTFGAAATAARLLKLDTTQTAHALALALAQATFSSEFKRHPNSTLRAVRDGFAAHGGLLAAMLAQRGVAGHLTAIEGKAGFFALFARGAWNEARLTDGLGRKFHGEDVSFKPWPSCRGTHAFIEAALFLRTLIERVSDIAAIRASGPELLTMLVEPAAQKQAPATAIDAKFSLPFCVAVALADGAVGIPSFFDEARGRAEILELARLMSLEVDPALTMKDAASGALTIRMKDGRVLTHRVARARGSTANALSDTELVEKFTACTAYAARTVDAVGASARLLGMDRAGSAAAMLAGLS
jgi:2-methylcitrate dehydratase PrpD